MTVKREGVLGSTCTGKSLGREEESRGQMERKGRRRKVGDMGELGGYSDGFGQYKEKREFSSGGNKGMKKRGKNPIRTYETVTRAAQA